MKTISADAFKKQYGDIFQAPAPTKQGDLGDFATGFAKGALQTGVETASLLQKGGQAVMAAVDPTRTFNQVERQTGFPSLRGEKLGEIRSLLTTQNTVEKAGKLSELVAEFLIPTGAANKITRLAETGIKTGTETIETGAAKVKDVAINGLKSLFKTPIPKQVQTALSETSGKTFDTYVQVGKKSIGSAKEITPLEFAGQRAEEALSTIQKKLTNIGSTKQQILSQATVGNKQVGNIVVKFRQNLNQVMTGKIEGDSKLLKEISDEARSLGNNPTAKQVDGLIDFIQDKIYASTRDFSVPVTDRTTGQIRRFVGELNTSLKSQLPDSYSRLNNEYSRIVNIRNELNIKLGKEGERAGALMKRVFSPSDANTKKLFQEVKTLSGVDLVDEATVARFVMETLGDARQASMLQQLQLPALSKSGMLQLAREILDKKFNSTDEILRRARELTSGSQLREAVIKSASQTKP